MGKQYLERVWIPRYAYLLVGASCARDLHKYVHL